MSDIVQLGDFSPDHNHHTVHRQRFDVRFSYDVHFTRGVFDPRNSLLPDVMESCGEKKRHRLLVAIDSGVAAAHPELVRQIKDYGHRYQERIELVSTPEIVAGGESVKSDWSLVEDLMISLGNHHMDRQSFVLAIGGGSVLDMVGFVAALVHRGLRLIRMPTTVLAQNDAGVGVKNGMNEHGMKNFVGTFAPPFAVINDFSFLPTLTDEHWRGGIAEAFKVALIKDAEFFDFLVRESEAFRARRQGPMEELIRRCAILHLEHIASTGDPFEMGTARPLDFGHWSAHKLETLSNYRISHGAAVAVGVALDSYYAMKKGFITSSDFGRVLSGLTQSGLAVWYPELDRRDANGTLQILAGLEEFREHLGGTLTVTLPRPVGEKCEVHHVNVDWVEEGIVYLRTFERDRRQTAN